MSRPEPAWKKTERRICRFLGGDRNPLSGGNSKVTRADCRDVGGLFVEAKHGSSAEISWAKAVELFAEVKVKALAEGKVPVLVLHRKREGGRVGNYPCFISAELDLTTPPGGVVLFPPTVISVPLSFVRELGQKLREAARPVAPG